MFTISYKGAFIHGYTDRPECFVQYGPQMLRKGPLPSLARAKWFIRQAIKNGDHIPA